MQGLSKILMEEQLHNLKTEYTLFYILYIIYMTRVENISSFSPFLVQNPFRIGFEFYLFT
ncbi:hypothetical protein HanXRQr2_Chr13g0597261 [Helianthus annuus]|uniref:Uncharacterized protein n=1 Tax=Helianthus annuus TaxID=4232 RepID=A0A9K3HCN6_HELAN|nr:hypothetical protein HanXRQr2_Chr13g0597261 [Helianthus annuus]KAJ0849986.1 hypothetical protein HanPSC8_Chr13g0575301 [Helianthus annuus]